LAFRFLRGVVNFLTDRLGRGILYGPFILAKVFLCIRVGEGMDFTVTKIETKWIEVAVQKSAFSLREHIECFSLICFHSRNRFQEHSLGFVGSAEFGCLRQDGG
jgi:hypothetical protein